MIFFALFWGFGVLGFWGVGAGGTGGRRPLPPDARRQRTLHPAVGSDSPHRPGDARRRIPSDRRGRTGCGQDCELLGQDPRGRFPDHPLPCFRRRQAARQRSRRPLQFPHLAHSPERPRRRAREARHRGYGGSQTHGHPRHVGRHPDSQTIGPGPTELRSSRQPGWSRRSG